MIVGVSPHYYTLTYRIVGQLKESGLVKIAKATHIPLEALKEFADKKKLPGEYIPPLYSHLFGTMSFLEANAELDRFGW